MVDEDPDLEAIVASQIDANMGSAWDLRWNDKFQFGEVLIRFYIDAYASGARVKMGVARWVSSRVTGLRSRFWSSTTPYDPISSGSRMLSLWEQGLITGTWTQDLGYRITCGAVLGSRMRVEGIPEFGISSRMGTTILRLMG